MEDVARRWHDGSDHARDGSPFGGHLCNCMRVAKRVTPMLAAAWLDGYSLGDEWGLAPDSEGYNVPYLDNPYEVQP